MKIFKVTIYSDKDDLGEIEDRTVVARNDAEAREKVVKKFLALWNKPFKDPETGKMEHGTPLSERDIWCEIELVTETDD